MLAVNDIEEYWEENYSEIAKGAFEPVGTLVSYDSEDPRSPVICGRKTYNRPNASYCFDDDIMSWDRGVFLPVAQRFFGEIAIDETIAHEYGHALQIRAELVDNDTPGLVFEQQADCFAGVYLRWVAEGESARFQVSTGDGLNHVLAGLITIRDELATKREYEGLVHGSAIDRVGAFRLGFEGGADVCAKIDIDEITQRRGDLPQYVMVDHSGDPQSLDVEITEDTLSSLMDTLGEIFVLKDKPKLSTEPEDCPDAKPSEPASYCPATNTISVDLPALQKLGTPVNEYQDMELLQGDNTALSIVTSRYALAVQHEKSLPIDSAVAAMRTACLTGVAQSKMAQPGNQLTLTAGDIDEAVSGLLINGLVASDVNGETVPAGFTRIVAYQSGLPGNVDLCYERFS